jgi:hypothetical protein
MRLVNFHHSSLAVVLAASAVCAQEKPVRFSGEVNAGQSFRKPIGRGLAFVLKGDEDGWIIDVEPEIARGEGCKDYSTVIATPLHGYTQNDLNVSYGVSAAEAVKRSPRGVEFVLDQAACKLESRRLERLLYPQSYSAAEVDQARAGFGMSPTGKAAVRIVQSKISAGKIDWIKFDVTIAFPPK